MRRTILFLLAVSWSACGAGSLDATRGMPRVERSAPFQYEGTAAEVLQAGSYTYVKVVPEGADATWAVGLHRDLAVGNIVQVRRFGRRTDFCSTRLGRCFDVLDFAVLGVPENP